MDDNNNKHILFLARWYPNRYDSMFGLFIQRHALAVAEYQKVSVIYLHADNNLLASSDYTFSKDKISELKWYYSDKSYFFSVFDTLFKGFLFFKNLYKVYKLFLVKENKPDIVHVNILTRMGVFALFLKWRYGIPYIITEHWSRYKPENGTYTGFLRKKITEIVVRNASAVTTVSVDLQNAMQNNNLQNSNYYTIPNVVDTDAFYPEKNKNNNKKEIVHISCFEEKSKNITGILRVIKALSQNRSDFICRMIGEGMDLEVSKKYAKEIGLTDEVVVFEGLKEGQDLTNLLRKGDLFLLFSNYENLPVVILESYACGVPVATTDVGGISEHMNADLGVMVKPNDEIAMVKAVEKILDNPRNYNTSAIRNYATENFSNKVVARAFISVYNSVLNKNK
ncbi:MAG: glycosyltransferase [Bacteroidota bacterium]|nr:glycosyltransferase [Bacteroidota bacterium]